MFYVFSTLTADNIYATFVKSGNDVHQAEKMILIKGGHGLATKHFITPRGVVTNVSDEDMEHLEANPVFQMHVKNGFIKVEKKAVEPEKVAEDMEEKDKSAPLTDKDFEKDTDNLEAAKPVIGKKKAA